MDGLIEGRIVHYILTAEDADAITRRRTDGKSIAERIAADKWPLGAQAHIGNPVQAGQHVAMVVTAVWNKLAGYVNGKCLLDGSDNYWVISAYFKDAGYNEPRTWHWIERD